MNPEILKVSLGRLELANPVMNASGTAGYGESLDCFGEISTLGAFVTKGISLMPRDGNPPPRIVETPSGMLNAIGLANIGLSSFLDDKLPFLVKKSVKIIVNIFGTSLEDFSRIALTLSRAKGISALEINVSCPNVKAGGMHFGMDPDAVGEVTRTVADAAPQLPLIVKLSPESPDIVSIAKSASEAGADAVCVMNTIRGLSIDVETRLPRLANKYGGLSGPAIRPLAVRLVNEIRNSLTIPIVGAGGIRNWMDAAEFILAGATAVQVGTALFSNPEAPYEIIEGLAGWSERQGDTISELSGAIKE